MSSRTHTQGIRRQPGPAPLERRASRPLACLSLALFVIAHLIVVPLHVAFDHHHDDNQFQALHDGAHPHDADQEIRPCGEGARTALELLCGFDEHDGPDHHSHSATEHEVVATPHKPTVENGLDRRAAAFPGAEVRAPFPVRPTLLSNVAPLVTPRLYRELPAGSRAPPIA